MTFACVFRRLDVPASIPCRCFGRPGPYEARAPRPGRATARCFRDVPRWAAALTVVGALTACDLGSILGGTDTAPGGGGAAQPADDRTLREQVSAMMTAAMADYHLQALIVRVTVDGREIATTAFGQSMTGVPATTDMHFRNGAVSFTYMGTLLAILAGRHQLDLDAPISTWLPALPHAAEISVRMLADMTSGYADYVYQPAVLDGTDADPFRQWSNDELIGIGVSRPLLFTPGGNWGYSHTNCIILGQIVEHLLQRPLAAVMDDEVLRPMGLRNTASSITPDLPAPVLHSYSAERRAFLQIPAGKPFIEDSTYWNPSWTTVSGAVQPTDIVDLATTAEKVGSGALVTPALYAEQVGNRLVGLGQPTADCPVRRTITADRGYGLGVLLLGSWIAQTKNLAGEGAAMAYLPERRIAIAVVTTLRPEAYDSQGAAPDPQPLLRRLGAVLAPDRPLGPA